MGKADSSSFRRRPESTGWPSFDKLRACPDLDPVTSAMLDFAAKLTREPVAMEESDVVEIREHGLTDEQILSVVLITCTFNFITRLADGLGVAVPTEHQSSVETWLTSPARDQPWLMQAKG